MTGYLVLTCGEASFARSGPLEMMRAGVAGSARASRRGEQGEQREQRARLLSDLPAGRVVEKAREGVVVRVRESCEAQRTNGSVSVSTFGGHVAAVDLDSREEETHRRRRSEPSPSH